jgi:hypothetical protein
VDDQLIGRDREQATLRAWVSAALAGRGSLVLLAGEAGVGKTSLVREALAGSGLGVLEGLGVQGGTSAFGPVVEALRSHRRATGGGPLLEGPLAAHLALLLPELGPPAPAGDRATLFEAIRHPGRDRRRPPVGAVPGRPPVGRRRHHGAAGGPGPLRGRPAAAAARSLPQRRAAAGPPDPAAAQRAAPGRPAAPGHGRAAGGRGQRRPAGTDAGDGGAAAAPGGVRPDRRRPLLRRRARLGLGGRRAPGGRAGRAGAVRGGGRPDPRQRPRRRAAAGGRALRRRPRRRRHRRRGRPDLRPRAGDGRRRAGRVAGRAAAPRHRDRGRPRAHGLPSRPGPRRLLRRDPLDPAGRPAPGGGRAAGGRPRRARR